MGLMNWLKGKMIGQESLEVRGKDVENYIDKQEMQKLLITEFTIHCAINIIANCISKCSFCTYENNKEKNGFEFYKWNVEPNKNQNANQFLEELIFRLLYYNECLVVESNEQLIIAESFGIQEFALKENIFNTVNRKGFTFNKTFNMSDVLYFQLNNKNIRKLLNNLCAGYNNLLSEAIEKYEKAGGEKGTLHINAAAQGMKYGNRTFEEVYEELMNERFKRFFNSRSAVLPLFDGFTYTKQAAEQSKKSTSEVKDITDITNEIIETVARAFNMPVSLLRGNVSDVKDITNNFLTFCIKPICKLIDTEIMRKRYGYSEFAKGNYIRIDTTALMHVDVFDMAERIDKLIASGMYCIDELRKKVGDAELNTEESTKHFITKNYTELKNMEGGQRE